MTQTTFVFNVLDCRSSPTAMTRSSPLETPVKGSEINPKHLSKAKLVKLFSNKKHGSVHGKEGVIKTITGPHAADSRDGLEIEYYWDELTIKGYGTEWVSTETYHFYTCIAAAPIDATPDATAAVSARAAVDSAATEPAGASSPAPDAAAAVSARAQVDSAATEPAGASSPAPDAAAAVSARAAVDSAATEPAGASSPAPDAAAAVSARAAVDSAATEPSGASSPAPDAAAAVSARAAVDSAATEPAGAHVGNEAAEPELCYSTVGTVDERWDFKAHKGWGPTASPSEVEAMVVSVKCKKMFSLGLGDCANQALASGRVGNSIIGENRLADDGDVFPGENAYSIDGWVTNGVGGYVNHVAVAGIVQFPKAMNATPKNYFFVSAVVLDKATKSWVFVNQELLMIPASKLSCKEGVMKKGSTALIQTALMEHRSFYNLPHVGSHPGDFRVTEVHKINPNAPRSQKKATTLLAETSQAAQKDLDRRYAKEAEASKKAAKEAEARKNTAKEAKASKMAAKEAEARKKSANEVEASKKRKATVAAKEAKASKITAKEARKKSKAAETAAMESDAHKGISAEALSDKLPRQSIALAPAPTTEPLLLCSDNIRRAAGVEESARSSSNTTSRNRSGSRTSSNSSSSSSSGSSEETLASVSSRRSSGAGSGYVSDGSDFSSSDRSGFPVSVENTSMMAFFKKHLELEEKKIEVQQKKAEENSKKEEEAMALENKLDALAWRRHLEQQQQQQSFFNTMYPFNMPLPQGPNHMQPYSTHMQPYSSHMQQGPNFMQQGLNHMQQGPNFMQPYSNYMQQGLNHMQQGPNFMQPYSNHMQQNQNFMQQGPNFMQQGTNHMQQGPNHMQQGPNHMQ